MHENSRKYLNNRGISDEVIERYRLGGDGYKITIPYGSYNKYRTHPDKQYFSDPGFTATIFGVEQLSGSWCVLTEGEMDALRLASIGVPAVSVSSGAGAFKDEWVMMLPKVVFICYDTDAVGKKSARAVHWKIPNSRVVELSEGKDITEFLEKHTKQEFEELIKRSVIIPQPPSPPPVFRKQVGRDAKLEEVKHIPITDYIKFSSGKALCLWHKESTPSMHYYPKTNKVHCFGCNKTGDNVDVLMALRGVPFREALNILKAL